MRRVIHDKGKYDGYGNFLCSVCDRDVFIQYDEGREKPSTGRLTTWRGQCYCLCWKCAEKCMDKGKSNILKNAKPYASDNEEPIDEIWKDTTIKEYESLVGMLPAVALLGMIAVILKLPKEQQKKILKKLIKERMKDEQ